MPDERNLWEETLQVLKENKGLAGYFIARDYRRALYFAFAFAITVTVIWR